MRHLMIGIAIASLLAVPAFAQTAPPVIGEAVPVDGFTEGEPNQAAEKTVGVEIVEYVAIDWDDADYTIVVDPAGDTSGGDNAAWIPFNVKSNCDVNVSVVEQLSKHFRDDLSFPPETIWGAPASNDSSYLVAPNALVGLPDGAGGINHPSDQWWSGAWWGRYSTYGLDLDDGLTYQITNSGENSKDAYNGDIDLMCKVDCNVEPLNSYTDGNGDVWNIGDVTPGLVTSAEVVAVATAR